MTIDNQMPLPLSKREMEILQYLSLGNTSEQIGNILFISKQTVDKHRKNMLKKMKVKNCTALVCLYTESITKKQ